MVLADSVFGHCRYIIRLTEAALNFELKRPKNMILSALQRDDWEKLYPLLEFVTLKARRVLQHARMPMDYLYFIEDGLVSVVAKADERRSVEVWLTGREGVAGVPLILGRNFAVHRRFIVLNGSAYRIRSDDLQGALREIDSLRSILFRYLFAVLLQTSQSSACNLCHNLTQRLARWVLTARDRCDADDLPITQDMLARMLGVRRASISECLDHFEKCGLLRKKRGFIGIVDRPRLETFSCGCYHIIRREQERILAPLDARSPRVG